MKWKSVCVHMHTSLVPLPRGQQSKYDVSKSFERTYTKKTFREKNKTSTVHYVTTKSKNRGLNCSFSMMSTLETIITAKIFGE